MADRSSDMTLAFSLEALERLADPAAAIDDAREWTTYVGAISAAPNGALTFTKERRIRLDFFSGTRPPAETLYAVKGNYRTDRYVLVGVDGQRELAEGRHWDFQHVEEAAERAGWTLVEPADDESGDPGVLGTIGRRVRGVLGR